jgi:hypothetical protein
MPLFDHLKFVETADPRGAPSIIPRRKEASVPKGGGRKGKGDANRAD